MFKIKPKHDLTVKTKLLNFIKTNNITQLKLSKDARISTSYISQFINGRRNLTENEMERIQKSVERLTGQSVQLIQLFD